MADSAGDQNGQQQQEHEQEPAPDPTDDLWKVAEGVVQLAGLYAECKQNEGAAHMATALVLLMNLWRSQS